MTRRLRPVSALLGCSIVAALMLARAALAQPPSTAVTPRLSASLLLIKADWSQSPAAKEIDSDLRKALSDVPVPKELLDELPASGAQVLFPAGIAGLYSNENYQQLLAWLKAKGAFQELKPCRQEKGMLSYVNSRGAPQGRSEYLATLSQPYDLVGLPPLTDINSQPFVVRQAEFQWFFVPALTDAERKVANVRIERRLAIVDRERGQEEFKLNRVLDACDFYIEALLDGHVWVANTFAAETESQLREAARRKGVEVLLVIGRGDVGDAAAATPALHLPSKVSTIQTNHRIGYQWPSDGSSARSDDQAVAGTPPSDGRSSSQKDSAAEAENKPDESVIKVFSLRNARAKDAERIVFQLFQGEIQSVAADERSNTLIVRGKPEQHNVIFALLLRLDEQLKSEGASSSTGTSSWQATQPTTSVAELTWKYEAKEKSAEGLARQIRELQSAKSSDKSRLDKLTADLRRVVGEAFSARQELHRAEAAQLQQRLAAIQQNVNTRERLGEQIIDRRVKDLLNPELQWGAAASSPPTRTATESAKWPGEAVGKDAGQGRLKEQTELFSRLAEDRKGVEQATADIAAATTDERRRYSGEVKLSLVRNIMIILLKLRQSGDASEQDIAAAEEELRKADAELAQMYRTPPPPRAETTSAPRPYPATNTIQRSRFVWGPESEHVFQTLGLTVEKLTEGDAPDPKYIGAMKITAINRQNPSARRLAVGDVVIGIQSTANASITMMVVRGSEQFTYRFPEAGDAPKLAKRRGASWNATPPRDLAAARAYRDKLRERLQALEQQYKAGTISQVEFLRASVEYQDAEIAASATPEGRQSLLREKVAALREIKTAVESLYRVGRVTQTEMLATEAEVLKAEAELAAETPAANKTTTPR